MRVVMCIAFALTAGASATAQRDSSLQRPRGALLFSIANELHAPVPGARVAFPALGVEFRAAGQLLVDHVADGAYLVEVRGPGYLPVERVVHVRGDTSRVDVVLCSNPPPSDTATPAASWLAEFERRHRDPGGPPFITRADLHSGQVDLLQALRSFRGIEVSPSRPGVPAIVRSTRTLREECPSGMDIFVDGLPSSAAAGDDIGAISLESILAVEVFPSAAKLSVRFRRAAGDCGALLVWTQTMQVHAKPALSPGPRGWPTITLADSAVLPRAARVTP